MYSVFSRQLGTTTVVQLEAPMTLEEAALLAQDWAISLVGRAKVWVGRVWK